MVEVLFCLVLIIMLPVLAVLVFSDWEQPNTTVNRDVQRISDDAVKTMEQLSSEFTHYVEQETRRYRR